MVAARLVVSISEAQRMLGDISRSRIYELIERGEIKKVNIGRRAFITTESITDFVTRLVESA